jgi:hypothetical protein
MLFLKLVMKFILFSILCPPFALLSQQTVHLTFRNMSLKSIPLVIPGVMNPNLSPLSNSGVELEYGQEVFYFQNGDKRRKALLFVIDDQFKDGEVLEINKLIKGKKKVLKNL